MSIKIKNLKEHEFVGQVVSSDDPLNMFRCKIRISGILDGVEDEHLPWIFNANTSTFGVDGFANGSYPKVGTWVKVKFPHNDIYSGEYMGIVNIDSSLQNELNGDYENSQVIAFDADEGVKILYTKAQGILISLDDNLIKISKENGEIVISSKKEIKIDSKKVTVNGDHFVRWEEMQSIFDTHTHLGNMGVITGPPSTLKLQTSPKSKTDNM